MLILDENQVEPCQVVSHEAGQREKLPGVVFKDKLFRHIERFPGSDNASAITLARQVYEDTRGQNLVLVVAEQVTRSVWLEDPMLGLPNELNLAMELEAIVAQMRNADGVTIKNRRQNFKLHPRCFVGHEATAWLVENLELSAEEALILGQRLIDERWMYHVTHDHGFKDADLFYRFYLDD